MFRVIRICNNIKLKLFIIIYFLIKCVKYYPSIEGSSRIQQ